MPPSSAELDRGSPASPSPATHRTLERLFAAWDRATVHWCFLRVPASLLRPESDLDLLLDPSDLKRAVIVAREHGFVPRPGSRFGTHLIAYHRETATWLWLHCVTQLTFGAHAEVRGDPAPLVLGRRSAGPPPQLAPGDEFWVTMAHCLLDRSALATRHRHRLAALAPQASADHTIAHSLDALSRQPASAQLLNACRVADWAALEGWRPALDRACRGAARRGIATRVGRLLQQLPARVSEARAARGIGVALLGPDGAGKSTLAAGIRDTFPFPVRQVYMGLTGGMLHHVDRLRVPGVMRLGRLLVIWSRYARAQYHIARGRLVVFDRYIYDADVPTPRSLSRTARLARWMDGRACPSPDMVVLLDAPGAVMHRRKGEYDAEMLEHWRRSFLALKQRVPGLVVVDATREIEEVRADVTERVWRRYSRGWDPT